MGRVRLRKGEGKGGGREHLLLIEVPFVSVTRTSEPVDVNHVRSCVRVCGQMRVCVGVCVCAEARVCV